MFRVIDLDPQGKLSVREQVRQVGVPDEGMLRWVDLQGDGESLDLLRDEFCFHPLAIEDCRVFDQRPKLEEYSDHLFLVTQSFDAREARGAADAPAVDAATRGEPGLPAGGEPAPRAPGEPGPLIHGAHAPSPGVDRSGRAGSGVQLYELHAFLGKNYLVTVHSGEIAALEQVWRRVIANPPLLERGVDFVYYLLASRLVEANVPILDAVTDELEELEDRVLSTPERRDLSRIFELKRQLVMMRKVLSPQRDTIVMLARRGDPRVSERSALYFRDVHDQLVRLNESIEANRDLLSNALDAYLSAVSNRTNEIMKYLTLLSAVFLPLAFIVGFFGQNF
ncbi:MAG TPA: magnesium transporter CorA family protein, partial [Polyangiaceae bacterium]|nr:magnesium transporter CorA family protein [Polyangiaceae bacterium]